MTDEPHSTTEFSPVRFSAGALELLDQTLLPQHEKWISCASVEGVADAIRRLAVRGAPAIGIAAAYGLVVALLDAEDPEPDAARRFANAQRILGDSRPTAVNLRWALEQGEEAFELLRRRRRAPAGRIGRASSSTGPGPCTPTTSIATDGWPGTVRRSSLPATGC